MAIVVQRLLTLDAEIPRALQRAGLRGLTIGDMAAGMEIPRKAIRAAVVRLHALGSIERHDGLIRLPAREWARLIDERRKKGAAKTFAADVAQLLAGAGEEV